MSKRDREYGDFLDDILAYTEKAQRFVSRTSYDEFVVNDEKIFAVVYALEVIGEAANRLPRSLTDRYPEVPWAKVIGMRNHLIHGYDVLDVAIIWATIQEDLPPLRQQIARILADLEQTSDR